MSETQNVSSRPDVISVRGCDDSTRISAESFTDAELKTLRKLQVLINAEGGGCQPTLHFGRWATDPDVHGEPYTYFKDEDEDD